MKPKTVTEQTFLRQQRRAQARRKAELKAKCRSGKRRYKTQEQAEQILASIAEASGRRRVPKRVYACPSCGGYHLTSQPKSLPPRSKKTAKTYREERAPFVARLLEERPACEIRFDANCTVRATTVHEVLKRSRGGSILDEANCMTACAYCNGAVEDHPEEAHRRGFAAHSWEKPA